MCLVRLRLCPICERIRAKIGQRNEVMCIVKQHELQLNPGKYIGNLLDSSQEVTYLSILQYIVDKSLQSRYSIVLV